jgi:5-methylcytosine-specific restriction endonuclease McrA
MDFTCPHCDNATLHRIEKYCPQCDKIVAHTAFHKNRSAPDNLSAWCKTCRKTKRAEPEAKDAYNAYMREWYGRHREEVAANVMKHYWDLQTQRQDDPALDEHLRTISRNRSTRARRRNPAKTNATSAAWAKANKPKINERRRKRYAQDPSKVKAQLAKRYALRRNAPVNDLTAEDWEAIKAHYGYRCVYCPDTCQECRKGTHKLTKEHLTPLSKEGPHTLNNVVPACRSCNGKRGNRAPLRPVQPLLL